MYMSMQEKVPSNSYIIIHSHTRNENGIFWVKALMQIIKRSRSKVYVIRKVTTNNNNDDDDKLFIMMRIVSCVN